MKRGRWIVIGGLVLAVGAGVAASRNGWWPPGASAQSPPSAPPAPRVVAVDVATAVRKSMPVRIDALGNVLPIATVAIKSRLETEIVKVHFADGALVREGEVLFTLDARTLEAQIRQAEGVVARDKAQLEGAERDVRRYTDLVAKGATPVTNLENAKTQADVVRATILADQSSLENLRVQLSYSTIRAPITGRIGAASVKVGNFVRPADTASLATINQIAPIYVAFGVPQRSLGEVRQAILAGQARVEATPQGEREPVLGRLTMVDNSVDASSGMVTVRATMDNKDEVLWPGTLVNTQLVLRQENEIVVPASAVQSGQKGTYVYVVQDGAARLRLVKVDRAVGTEAVIASGLEESEVVVTDGQLLLADGVKVAVRGAKAGA